MLTYVQMLINLKNWKLIEFMYNELWRDFWYANIWFLKNLDKKITKIIEEQQKNEENEQNAVKSA